MASESEFVRKDVYEADQRALMSEIKLGNAEILKRFDQIAIELNGKIEKLNVDINSKIDKVNSDLNGKIDKFNSDLNGRIDKLESDLNSKIDKVYSDLNGKIDKVNSDLNGRIDKLEADINGRFDRFEAQTNSRFDKLEARIEVIDANVQYLNKRLDDTQIYMGWILGLIGILVAIAVVTVPYFFRKIFKPSITLEQVEELINTKIEQAFMNHRLTVS